MLEFDEVAALEKKLRDTDVLSVYINGTLSNPAERNAWRLILDNGVNEARARLESGKGADVNAFNRAVAHLYDKLPADDDIHASRGWAGFFTADGAESVEGLATSVTDMVSWDRGMRVAPILRSLKQLTPVMVVLGDSRTTQLFHYQEGTIEQVEEIEAEAVIGPVHHMGDAPRSGFRAGVRGSTGADEAERITRAAIDKMHRAVQERLVKLADRDAWIVIGGTAEASSDIENLIPAKMKDRVMINDSLHMRSRQAEIAEAAKTGASELRKRSDASLIDLIAELAGANGRGAVGLVPTQAALKEHRVQMLLITGRLMEAKPGVAESLVRMALQQGATIEHVTGTAATRLDEDFDGVAARLRFVLESAQAG